MLKQAIALSVENVKRYARKASAFAKDLKNSQKCNRIGEYENGKNITKNCVENI
jgi:hypothetical protein